MREGVKEGGACTVEGKEGSVWAECKHGVAGRAA